MQAQKELGEPNELQPAKQPSKQLIFEEEKEKDQFTEIKLDDLFFKYIIKFEIPEST